MDARVDRRLITRVALRNYKSISACDAELHPLTILIGPNGAGKSNFLDALRFTAQALRLSLDHAMRERGGFAEVCHRAATQRSHFGFRLGFRLTDAAGWYAFDVGARGDGGYVVRREECRIPATGDDAERFFRIEHGRCVATSLAHPPLSDDGSLYLVRASNVPEFRSVFRALASMVCYHIDPRTLGGFHTPTGDRELAPDGSNAAAILSDLKSRHPAIVGRITDYLGAVVADITGVEARVFGNRHALEFRQRGDGAERPRPFFADSMSDGVLHVLGAFLALFQNSFATCAAHLIGIEEPVTALYPEAAGVLMDVLLEASERTQVIVTTHSADLLDRESIPVDSILPVVSLDRASRIGPVDDVGRSVLQDGTFTAGELLRIDQLHPDPDLATPQRIDLFCKD